jgi:uncharacterized membrane protein
MKRWTLLAIVVLIASVPAGCMSYIAGTENSQGEFDNAAGQLSLWLLFTHIFLVYFIPLFLLLFLCLCLPAFLRDRGRRVEADPASGQE